MPKQIAREKRQCQPPLAIFPSAYALVLRQEVFYAAPRKLVCHALLMVRAGVHRIPPNQPGSSCCGAVDEGLFRANHVSVRLSQNFNVTAHGCPLQCSFYSSAPSLTGRYVT